MSKIQLGKGWRHSGLLLKFKIINLSCTDIVYMQWKKFPVFGPSSVWTKFLPDFRSFIHILDLLLSFLLSASLHIQESAGLLFMHWKPCEGGWGKRAIILSLLSPIQFPLIWNKHCVFRFLQWQFLMNTVFCWRLVCYQHTKFWLVFLN